MFESLVPSCGAALGDKESSRRRGLLDFPVYIHPIPFSSCGFLLGCLLQPPLLLWTLPLEHKACLALPSVSRFWSKRQVNGTSDCLSTQGRTSRAACMSAQSFSSFSTFLQCLQRLWSRHLLWWCFLHLSVQQIPCRDFKLLVSFARPIFSGAPCYLVHLSGLCFPALELFGESWI